MMRALILFGLLVAGPALAQDKWVLATTTPPPGHSCLDLYRGRDLPSTFARLYVPDAPIAGVYCTPVAPWLPERWRPERGR